MMKNFFWSSRPKLKAAVTARFLDLGKQNFKPLGTLFLMGALGTSVLTDSWVNPFYINQESGSFLPWLTMAAYEAANYSGDPFLFIAVVPISLWESKKNIARSGQAVSSDEKDGPSPKH